MKTIPHAISFNDLRLSPALPDQPSELRHADILRYLNDESLERIPGWRKWTIGFSVEKRPLTACSVGTGPITVMLWSQMHGDEPTHTAVLLQLLHFLTDTSEDNIARQILDACTLIMIPMLNPDGAERWTRRNAQDIDINRDAQHRQTPEGRALWSVLEEYRPSFAFNLHNQSRRMAVHGTGRAAAISLLVPSIDAARTLTEQIRAARHVASVFCRTVRDHCPGMVSRYSDEFMARAFGESVQQTGCRTILVEAGDWPDHSPTEFVQLHLLGLVQSLASIADESYRSVSESIYESLPACSEYPLCDVKVIDATVFDETGSTFRADLAINFTSDRSDPLPAGSGRIVDIGDLHVHAGITEFRADGGICAPGGFLFNPNVTPNRLPGIVECENLLSKGITTILGVVALDDDSQWSMLQELHDVRLPIHFGFLGAATRPEVIGTLPSITRLWSPYVLGIVNESLGSGWNEALAECPIPRICASELPQSPPADPMEWRQWHQWAAAIVRQVRRADHSSIRRDMHADLLLFSLASVDFIGWDALDRVLVGGTTAWTRNGPHPERGGRLRMREW